MKSKRPTSLKIGDKTFSLTRNNKLFLEYMRDNRLLKCNTDDERKIVSEMLHECGVYGTYKPEVTILCKKCKQRMRSYTAGETLQCSCGSVYFRSEGTLLDIRGPYRILLVSPSIYQEETC